MLTLSSYLAFLSVCLRNVNFSRKTCSWKLGINFFEEQILQCIHRIAMFATKKVGRYFETLKTFTF